MSRKRHRARSRALDAGEAGQDWGEIPAALSASAMPDASTSGRDPSAAPPSAEPLSPSVLDTLARIRALQDAGETRQAQQLYSTLRHACGECDLPEDMAVGLRRLPPHDSP